MRGLLAGALLSLYGPSARADEGQDFWEQLNDGLLRESLYGDLDGAIAIYSDLRQRLPAGHPIRPYALYWMGRAKLELGDPRGAREALLECIRSVGTGGLCEDTLSAIELDKRSIEKTPVAWGFDDADHGFVLVSNRGSIRTESLDQNQTVLAWTTMAESQNPNDRLMVGFRDPKPPPRGMRFTVRANNFDAHLRIWLYDVHRRVYTLHAEPIVVPTTETVVVNIPLASVRPVDPEQPPLDPAELHRVELRDVTGYRAQVRGINVLLLDDFEVY